MPFGSVTLRPGVNTERTPTLLEAGYHQTQLVREVRGQVAEIMITGGMTHDYQTLNDLFRYDPESGVVFWKKNPSKRNCIGLPAGTLHRTGYYMLCVDRKKYAAHRMAWFLTYREWPRAQIDHVNGIRSDNRLANLREATPSQNRMNEGKRSGKGSVYKGVSWHGIGKKWQAHIWANGKHEYLGLFETEEMASAAYKHAASRLHGSFARIV